MAGARLSRLTWRPRDETIDLLVPAASSGLSFDSDHWPKCGAFPMIPYNNRLMGGMVWWAGRSWQTRVAPGQAHGTHGFGHRVPWQVESHTGSHVALVLEHAEPSPEWQWPFIARIEYELSSRGLSVSISLKNTADESAPIAIGWHPYFASTWTSMAGHQARCVYDLGDDGLAYPHSAGARAAPTAARDGVAQTFAFEQARSPWTLESARGELLTLSHDGLHVVHHQPPGHSYECVEPVTALPGAMARVTDDVDQLSLPLGEMRTLRCRLSASSL